MHFYGMTLKLIFVWTILILELILCGHLIFSIELYISVKWSLNVYSDHLIMELVLVWSLDTHILPSPHIYWAMSIGVTWWHQWCAECDGQCMAEYRPFGANWTARCSAGHWGGRHPRLYSQRMRGSDDSHTMFTVRCLMLGAQMVWWSSPII